MSLLKLLADFPNYSARKVRRLANQLKWLDGSQDPQAKNIAADLMDYNVQSAQLEERLNDDVKVEVPLPGVEQVHVCPTADAFKAIQEMQDWIDMAHTGAAKEGELPTSIQLSQRVKGIISGRSFYTDKVVHRDVEDQT